MKKILLTMLGVALMAAPALAQVPLGVTAEKVDVNKLKAAIAKSDAEIADAKKAAKVATWIKRGNTLIDVDGKPVNGVYATMPEAMLKATYGDATPTVETIAGREYTVYTYDPATNTYLRAYQNGQPHNSTTTCADKAKPVIKDCEQSQLAPSVVIGMLVTQAKTYESSGYAREDIVTTGTGQATIFQNGDIIEAFETVEEAATL